MTNKFLSKENTDCLKGILALAVLVHHLYQHSGILRGNPIGFLFQSLGFLAVAVFFFLSGYGLVVSFLKKGDAYIRELPRNRILPFYGICCVLIVLYTLFFCLIGSAPNIGKILLSFIWGGTVIANGWYLQTSLLLYVVFYLCFRFGKTKKQKVFLVALTVFLYCVFCYAFSFSVSWYVTTPAFVVGILWGVFGRRMQEIILSKKRFALLAFGTVAFLMFWLFGRVFSWLPDTLDILFKAIACCFFVFDCIVLTTIVPIENRFTAFLGKISLEIYVVQGFFLNLYHTPGVYIENAWMYIAAVTVSTLVFSVMLHPIFAYITRLLKAKK